MFNVQRSMFNVQRSTFNVQRSMFNVQCSTFNVQCSMFNVQCSMFNVQRSMFNVQRSMFDVQGFAKGGDRVTGSPRSCRKNRIVYPAPGREGLNGGTMLLLISKAMATPGTLWQRDLARAP
jgi:hypothetical protein